MRNYISTPLITARLAGGPALLTLPGLLAAGMADGVEDIPALRPHQRQALHAFLAQLGALALLAAGRTSAPQDEEEWRGLLRGLTPQWPDDEPWSLVVEDLSKPALLQPPVPEGSLAALKESETTPDALDMLVTSKNHDLKAQRLYAARPEHWFFALLTLQTMEGFLGAGNYGVVRMNGGFASRPMVGVAPPGGWGARLRRDIQALVADHTRNAANGGYPAQGGKALLWLEPWDGKAQLPLQSLDPYFIEVCRRVRLVEQDSRILARRGSSAAARIFADKAIKGRTGDPWAPQDSEKLLTVDGDGFHYGRVSRLLDPAAYTAAPLQKPRSEDGKSGLVMAFTATARGQGGTDGFHERRVVFPGKAAGILAREPDKLGELAKAMTDEAGNARRRPLNTALLTLFQNAPGQVNYNHAATKARAEPFLAGFDASVDTIYFDHLFARLEADGAEAKDAARLAWLKALRDVARRQLERAEQETPRSGLRRQFAVSAARDALAGLFVHTFPELKKPEPEEAEHVG